MTDTRAEPTALASARPRVPHLHRLTRLTRPARPVWETAFRDPVRDSHIRLGGLVPVERQVARVGLVTLGLLLVSVLFSSVWRRGTLLPLDAEDRFTFLPVGLLPVTLVAFLVAWLLLTWGALAASPVTRVVVAATFLLTNASLGIATSIDVGHHAALAYGPHLVRAGYFLTAGTLVLSALLNRLARTSRALLPVFRLLTLAGVGMFFLSHLWIHVVFVRLGFAGSVQQLMSGAIAEINGLLLPLVFVSGILVIDFSLDVAEGVSLSVREIAPRVARWLLVGLLAVKLWIEVVHRWGDWVTYVQDRPLAVVRTLTSVALLALVVRLVTRGSPTSAYEDAKERLLYGSGAALALGSIVSILVIGVGVVDLAQLHADQVPGFVDAFPAAALSRYGNPTMAAVALAAGGWLLRRRRGPMDVELGSGLVVLGAWTLPAFLLDLTSLELGFSDPLVDVAVTVAVAVFLAARWRRIGSEGIVTLAAVTVFAWLVMSRGDWIAVLGGLFGLPVVLVVVVGIAFSLAGDAAFTAESSPRLPQGARVLLFVGYLILSVTILHWVETTHGQSFSGGHADAGFFFLGLPWAAWLVGRRLVHLDDGVDDDLDGIPDADQVPA